MEATILAAVVIYRSGCKGPLSTVGGDIWSKKRKSSGLSLKFLFFPYLTVLIGVCLCIYVSIRPASWREAEDNRVRDRLTGFYVSKGISVTLRARGSAVRCDAQRNPPPATPVDATLCPLEHSREAARPTRMRL
jgi:hypothetical protein